VSNRTTRRVDSASFELARQWVHDCLNDHAPCPKPTISTLPKRVLDIGPEGKSQEVKLFTSHGHEAHYTALSYCWGGPQPITLTLNTIEAKKQGMAINELPKTAQDAIKVTRELGIRYLWIDALCIIQDSDSDKAEEIAKMDQIYSNAFVTICAANVADCRQSFLDVWSPRSAPDPYRLSKLRYPCPEQDGPIGSILVEERKGYEPSGEALNRRGWTLQERLLSSRLLTFGTFQMYWECRAGRYCDGGTIHDFDGDEFTLRDDIRPLERGDVDEKGIHALDIQSRWWSICREYSRRKLSFYTDKLPALSGIATKVAKLLKEPYCAGLWRSKLQSSLAWQVLRPRATKRPPRYRAPSWSWMSLDAEVDWKIVLGALETVIVNFTKIVDCRVEPVLPAAPFSELSGGILEIRGRVRDLDWDGEEEIRDADDELLAEVLPDIASEVLTRTAHGELKDPVIFSMGEALNHDVGNVITRPVSCIPLTDIYSLMLERQPDGKYVRIGLMSFFGRGDNPHRQKFALHQFYANSTLRTLVVK
jgi:Heterokaryon incompatibility protein (HET)